MAEVPDGNGVLEFGAGIPHQIFRHQGLVETQQRCPVHRFRRNSHGRAETGQTGQAVPVMLGNCATKKVCPFRVYRGALCDGRRNGAELPDGGYHAGADIAPAPLRQPKFNSVAPCQQGADSFGRGADMRKVDAHHTCERVEPTKEIAPSRACELRVHQRAHIGQRRVRVVGEHGAGTIEEFGIHVGHRDAR